MPQRALNCPVRTFLVKSWLFGSFRVKPTSSRAPSVSSYTTAANLPQRKKADKSALNALSEPSWVNRKRPAPNYWLQAFSFLGVPGLVNFHSAAIVWV